MYGFGNDSQTHLFGVPLEIFQAQYESETDLIITKRYRVLEEQESKQEVDEFIPFFRNPPRVEYQAKLIPVDEEYFLQPDEQELEAFTFNESEDIIYDGIQKVPSWLFSDEKIKLISLAEKYSLIVTESNRVFGLGKVFANYYTGISIEMNLTTDHDIVINTVTDQNYKIGKLLKPPSNALIIKSSYTTHQWWNILQIHTMRGTGLLSFLILLKDGSLYACGDNSMNQLALVNNSLLSHICNVPIYTHFNQKIVKVSMGNMFTLFLTTDGRVYGCGNSRSGQLALQSNKLPNHIPKQIMFTNDERICMIESYNHLL